MGENAIQAQSFEASANLQGQLVTRGLDQLRPHPSYERHKIAVPACKLSALAKRGDLAFREPLAITRENIILDGYARWTLAASQQRQMLPCIEYPLSENEALHWILQVHRRSPGLIDFARILLALELEPVLQDRARSNQQIGGQQKGLSKLTEAQKIDVRTETAAIAGVSVGNITKVKQLIMHAHPALLEALQTGEVRIHRAWLWSKLSRPRQQEQLWQYRSERGVKKKIHALISRHESRPAIHDVAGLLKGLAASQELGTIQINVTQAPGRALFITQELLDSLGYPSEP